MGKKFVSLFFTSDQRRQSQGKKGARKSSPTTGQNIKNKDILSMEKQIEPPIPDLYKYGKKEKFKELRKNKKKEREDKKVNEIQIIEDLQKRKVSNEKQVSGLLSKLTQEELNNYREAFSLYDRNGDGTIDENELMYVMRSLGENPSEDQMTYIMHEMDTDANGIIDFQEFLVAMAARRQQYDSTEDLRKAFEVFDRDGNGTVDAEELRDAMTAANGPITMDEAEELLRLADINGDGLIDYNEFVAMMKSD